MIYTHTDKSKLPTITETVSILKDVVVQLPKVQLMPFDCQSEAEFILTRTNFAYSIKPNIQKHSTLFMGVPRPLPILRGSWWNFKRNEFMIQNVLQEDVRIVMESHPMFALFRDGFAGIHINNPYGIGMAYGQSTATMPLTSDIDIAAFFASHAVNLLSGECEPCKGGCGETGMLYLFELYAPMPYIPGLSTIGKQPFLRPGLMKLFAYDTNPKMDFNSLPFVKGFEFRHEEAASKEVGQRFSSPQNSLFPSEIFANKVNTILSGNKVSLQAIERNLRDNPNDSRDVNIRRLQDAGYKIVDSLELQFSEDELKKIWYNDVLQKWHSFWCNVSLCNIKKRTTQEILDLPNNDQYKRYFV